MAAATEAQHPDIRNDKNAQVLGYIGFDGLTYFEGAGAGIDPVDGFLKPMAATYRYVGMTYGKTTIVEAGNNTLERDVSVQFGQMQVLTVPGVAQTDVWNALVRATDDNTYEIGGLVTDVNHVGLVVEFIAANTALVWIRGREFA